MSALAVWLSGCLAILPPCLYGCLASYLAAGLATRVMDCLLPVCLLGCSPAFLQPFSQVAPQPHKAPRRGKDGAGLGRAGCQPELLAAFRVCRLPAACPAAWLAACLCQLTPMPLRRLLAGHRCPAACDLAEARSQRLGRRRQPQCRRGRESGASRGRLASASLQASAFFTGWRLTLQVLIEESCIHHPLHCTASSVVEEGRRA